MVKLIEINRKEAIEVMENNLKILKECSDSDTFLILSYDLEKEISMGNTRLDRKGGIHLMNTSKTFVLNKDCETKYEVSTLSIYTARQKDIYNILPFGKKHDMVLIPK